MKTMWQRLVFLALAGCMTLFPAYAAPFLERQGDAVQRFEYVQPHMGTAFRIVLYAESETIARKASDAANARISHLDRILSDYKDDSELLRLCKQSGGPPVFVSAELFTVLEASQRLAEASGGAFDVTAGPVIQLWRRARRQRELPAEARLKTALDLVGFRHIHLDAKARTVRLLKPDMLLDLGGIAKGYAADEALRMLKEHRIQSALVAAGGDIVVSGPPPGAAGWTIGVAAFGPAPEKLPQLLLQGAAVSTSGDAEQFIEIAGIRFSHIVDPRTGQALTGRMGVTVVARHGIDSDGLATAVSVLGADKGLELVDRIDGAAALIMKPGPNGLERHASKRWKDVPAP
jgi:thiamine biosynthesis lipoprotein